MRPSDENQASSTRPNLMSASHRGGEDSILAKLERDPARRHRNHSPLRVLWYGASALVAVGLTATLVWLASGTGKQQPILAQATVLAAPAADPPPVSGAAALVDEPPPPPPPLRMLEKEKLPPAVATPSVAAVATSAVPEPAMAAPARQAVPRPAPAPTPRSASAPAPAPKGGARSAAKPAALAKAERAPAPAQRERAAARTEARAEVRPAARPAPRPAVRPARPATPAKPAEQPVDSDVALISAVIVHANGHAEARTEENPPCADDACRARSTRP
ncbi:hypothetical protein [Massilia sp. KIM]|uniref:hypothetical protein n=1 Tax=Massilia sp. KIM TaxID=1955422 RepID=UPI0011809E8E|nr:hypothetical protein [Massilia sp. KIM]